MKAITSFITLFALFVLSNCGVITLINNCTNANMLYSDVIDPICSNPFPNGIRFSPNQVVNVYLPG